MTFELQSCSLSVGLRKGISAEAIEVTSRLVRRHRICPRCGVAPRLWQIGYKLQAKLAVSVGCLTR
jgi:hypothetical protein